MRKHTPGPWRIGTNAGAIVTDEPLPGQGEDERQFYGGYLVAESVAAHDRPLIAAAPMMLELLRALEWTGLEDHPDGGYYGACPLCGGGDPGNPATPIEYGGHEDNCELARLLAEFPEDAEMATVSDDPFERSYERARQRGWED